VGYCFVVMHAGEGVEDLGIRGARKEEGRYTGVV
jgi:hypothetical protein